MDIGANLYTEGAFFNFVLGIRYPNWGFMWPSSPQSDYETITLKRIMDVSSIINYNPLTSFDAK